MIDYVRSRGSLWAAAGLTAGGILTVWNAVIVAPAYLSQSAVRNDFRLDYSAALVGLDRGYGHLYDLAAQGSEMARRGFNPQPFISPPPLAWLATPFTALPFSVALVLWTLLLLAALLWTWWALAPGGRLARAAHLALWLGLFPVAFGLLVGQPGALVAAAVAASWWLLRHERPTAAGVVLSLLVLKPQLALLVPLCLLVAGQRRVFTAWLAVSAVIGVAALAVLGPDGVSRYRDALAMTQGPAWDITRRYSISGPLGPGVAYDVAAAFAVGLALIAAWRGRARTPEVPIAAGIAGSLLFSPYLGFQDLLMLVVAAWLVIRAGATVAQVVLFVAGYVLLEVALPVLALPTLMAEVGFLVTLAWSRRWDSNPRPATYEAAALPTELRRR